MGLFWWLSATIDQMLFFPTTLFGGILFQLIVFIFARGVGVSCCGKGFNESEVVSFGVFGLVTSLCALRRLGAGGGGAGPFMGGGGGMGAGINGKFDYRRFARAFRSHLMAVLAEHSRKAMVEPWESLQVEIVG